MKMRTSPLLLAVVAACSMTVAGCSSSTDDSDVPTSTSATVSSSEAAVAESPTSSPTTPVSVPPAEPPPPAPITFECGDPSLYQSGTAIYSDGTTGYEASCDTYVPPTGSQDQNGDGVISGFKRCGTACGEEPTSGEIQTQHGCEQGYITGPLCHAVGPPQQ
ncbi:UNVERIFIED_CONTAM: hypothetical protein DES50_10568 [Williamsia faeni]